MIKELYNILGSNRVLKNISWTMLAKIVAMLLFFLTDIMSARLLSISQYGQWNYFFSIKTMYAYVGYFGIDQGTKLQIAKLESENERQRCYRSGMILRTIVSTIVAIVGVISAGYLNSLLNKDGKYDSFYILLIFGGVLALFNAYQEFFKEIGYGIGDNKQVFIVTLAEYGFVFACTLLCLIVFSNIYGMLIGYIVAGCITLIFCYNYLKREHHYLNLKTSGSSISYQKQILKYAIPLLMANIANLVCMELDTTMIGMMSISQEVAVYNVGKKLCTKAGHVNLAIAGGTMTTFAIINAENYEKKMKTFFKTLLLDIIVTLGVSLALCLVAKFMIPILYGEAYTAASRITILMIPYYMMFGISSFLALFLDFRNRSTIRSMVSIGCICLNACLNLIFIRKFGAVGAVYTTVMTQVPYFIYTIIASILAIMEIRRDVDKR